MMWWEICVYFCDSDHSLFQIKDRAEEGIENQNYLYRYEIEIHPKIFSNKNIQHFSGNCLKNLRIKNLQG